MFTEGWLKFLMEYTFETEYISGDQNYIADTLSHCYESIQLKMNRAPIIHSKIIWRGQ
jgi:hypothetical protein